MLMDLMPKKVGIIPCNGEEICEGTLTRFASRKVLDKLRPGSTVTICLPLFIAGGEEERNFAKTFPTITVDGCDKRCSQKSTERLSAKPYDSIVVSEVLQKCGIKTPRSRASLTGKDQAAVDAVADEIAKKVDEIQQGKK
ncbi:MAG: putative zinc-binding protein [Proteobacteria bacterium]|nr:putative zinc-binding protein [Pseudomonadota bacterium]